ncbi:MAG TPA: hypothetical protein VI072_23365 [Polyangiaceae bacterium]
MCAFCRHLTTWAALLWALVLVRPAAAWTETTVKSHLVTVDVERDGSAVIGHELLVRVRGAAMTQLDIDGISADAEPLPDAAAAFATSGVAGETVYPLLLNTGEDGVLRVEVDAKKGLRQGTYLFKFRYRTRLLEEKKLVLRGSWVEVRWIGPRLADGLDSARVIFRIPTASTPPKLPDESEERGAPTELQDTFLTNLRRGSPKDELEVVRPHIAKGEPVLWRILASPKAFDVFASSAPAATQPGVGRHAPKSKDAPLGELIWLLALGFVALAYGVLVFWKARAVAAACERSHANARALIPIFALGRAALAGVALAGACFLALYVRAPTAAAAVFLVCSMLAAHARPRAIQPPRGPGRWLPLRDEEAFAASPRPPGHWLDAGTRRGAACFAGLMAVLLAGAWLVFRAHPYEGLLLSLSSSALLPVFFTGRSAELLPDPAFAPRRFLRWQAERLKKDATLKVVPWARVPDLGSEMDELRLLVLPRRAKTGLVGLEVGVEYCSGAGGPIALPFVLVRALDGAAACAAFPEHSTWTRGRKPEERVLVLQPRLPTRAGCRALLLELIERLRAPSAKTTAHPHSRSFAMSAGKAASTAKGFRLESPVQLR